MNFRQVDRKALARTTASLYIKARGWFVLWSLVVVVVVVGRRGGRRWRWSFVGVAKLKLVSLSLFAAFASKVLRY